MPQNNVVGAPLPYHSTNVPDNVCVCCRILIDDVSLNMFTNICRGLFEKDKMLYAFMIAVGILRQAGKVRRVRSRPGDAYIQGLNGVRCGRF